MEDNFTEIVLEGVRINKHVIDQLKEYQSQARDNDVLDVETINLAILFLLELYPEIKDEDHDCLLSHLWNLSEVAKHIR